VNARTNDQSRIQRERIGRVADHERCIALVRIDPNGKAIEPRRCRVKAKQGLFCGVHAGSFARIPLVTSADGGWCIWCSQPARRYECSRADRAVSLALCMPCGTGLYRELAHHLKKRRKKRDE
jgi:hypothetical protein